MEEAHLLDRPLDWKLQASLAVSNSSKTAPIKETWNIASNFWDPKLGKKLKDDETTKMG